MKKDLINKNVVRAISLGLSAVMLTTPMTALAAEVEVEPIDTDPEVDLAETSVYEDAEEAIDNAQNMTDIAADAVDVEKVPALEGVEVDPDPETEGDEFTYDDVKVAEEQANDALQAAEADIIQADAELAAAKVDVEEADAIIGDVNDNNQIIADANEKAAQAVTEAEAAKIEAQTAPTEEVALAAVEDAKKAVEDAQAAQSAAQDAYDDNLLKLQAAYDELESARQNLADMQAKVDATTEEIKAAQELADKALAEAEALEKEVAAKEVELTKTREGVLKAKYDEMIKQAELAARYDTYDDAPAYPDEDVTGEFEDEFGFEYSSNGKYWEKARQYFFLYLKEWYAEQGLKITSTKWEKENILDNGKAYDSEVDNTYTITYIDKDGKEKTAYYNYHTQKADETKGIVKGDITIYEKEIGEETVTTTVDHGLSYAQEDADGNVTYIKYDDVKDENNDIVRNVKDAEGNDTGSILVKDANSVLTADVNDYENYKASLGNNQTTTVSEKTETEYEIGEVTVVDSYEKKKDEASKKTESSFSNSRSFRKQVEDAVAVGKAVEVSWDGLFGTYKIDVDNVDGLTILVDRFAELIGKGLKIDVYDMVDDTTRPKETHTEQGIIAKTTADVTTTTVTKTESAGYDGYFEQVGTGLFGMPIYDWVDSVTAAERAAQAEVKRLIEQEGIDPANITYTVSDINVWGESSYTITVTTSETSKKVIQTQSYTATGYSNNTETVENKIKIWTERADQSGDEFIKSLLQKAREQKEDMEAKKAAAAAATAAAKAAKDAADAAWVELQEVEVGDAGYSEAVKKYDAAKTAFKAAEEDLAEIKQAALDAEEDYNDAIDSLDRFIPTPSTGGDDAGDDGDDDTTPTTPVVVPVVAPEEIPTATVTPVAGGAGAGAGAGAAQNLVDIDDEDTPLAAGIDNADGDGDANGGEGDDVLVAGAEDETAIVAIEDEETPLAAGSGADGKMSWWWLLIVALLGATGYKMYKDHQKKKEEAAQEA